jgi:hypothetical protein
VTLPAADWAPQPPDLTPSPPAAGRRGFPPPGWPVKDQLDYTSKAITTLLLVLALPWLAYKLVTNPREVLTGAAQQHIRPRPR